MTAEVADAYETLVQFLYRAPIGLAQTALDGTIEMINPMSARLLMPLSREGNLDNLFDVLAPFAPQLGPMVRAFDAGAGVVCDALRIAIDGVPAQQRGSQVLSISLLKLEGCRLMAVLSDVTTEAKREQQRLDRSLSDAARIDSLTRMPNRAAVRERIQAALWRGADEPGHEFAVLFMNCDRFKQVNDTLGHAAGNEVLGLMADRLRTALRTHDGIARTDGGATMAARIGGDEFVVILEDLRHAENAHGVAQRLLDLLSKPYGIGANQLQFSISMGVVLRAQAAGDADAVLQDASIAMVEAKRGGGGRYVIFEAAMRQRAAHRGALEADLRRALVENQLYVVYQPVVGLQDPRGIDRSAGVEALVRWRHPTRGVVQPLEFIGVAEECGLINAIGDFVLDTACRQFIAWQAQLGTLAPRTLAVNLSRAQLAQADLAVAVHEIVRATGLAPNCLQLEITESLAAQDAAVRARLHELKALGLTLALDDFGTGYSSLSSLHEMPVDTVKIDRSFVSQADSSPRHRVLIEATIRVAQSLGMSTVAEGIETASQAHTLRELGCSKGQGYFFAKPLAADELAQWLAAVRPVI